MITVNGVERELTLPLTIHELLASLGHAERGVAVAVNDAVVPRAAWATTSIADGMAVEILTAVQGG